MNAKRAQRGLPTDYQKFIHLSRYARWIGSQRRRELEWDETIDRFIAFFKEHLGLKEDAVFDEIRAAILGLEVMPSMRCLMTAGEALRKDNAAGYNCSYMAIDRPSSFDEALYLLMCGVGVGFSVERQYINSPKMPEVPDLYPSDTVIVVKDSKIGWSQSLKDLVSMLYAGSVPKWDISRVRPAGARLKTFGGRASGPEPLVDLFKFVISVFRGARGRKLNSIECHDLMCKIGDIVVAGGVRRSALISLSNLSDNRMREAKCGEWWTTDPHRALANNSACYTETPEMQMFLEEWLSLVKSKSGERGIFNRVAAQNHVKRHERRDHAYEFGTNPCSEIILRSRQFCNLTEAIVRPNDTPKTLAKKVELATIIGTFQSTLTDFRYLSRDWKTNSEEERLLGVSLTGIMDSALTSGVETDRAELCKLLDYLRSVAVKTNKKWAEILGIQQSAAITCVKPSGTVSQLVDSSSGIHPRYSPHYIRTVRADKKDPLVQMMIEMGFPHEDDIVKPTNAVFSFPIKSPDGSVCRDQFGAIKQLELWSVYNEHWCEHKPSVTIYVRDEEWLEVGAWVYKNFSKMSGISFLPHTEHVYRQAPYQEITVEEYEKALALMPNSVDWSKLTEYEKEDMTTGSREYACVGGNCELTT